MCVVVVIFVVFVIFILGVDVICVVLVKTGLAIANSLFFYKYDIMHFSIDYLLCIRKMHKNDDIIPVVEDISKLIESVVALFVVVAGTVTTVDEANENHIDAL